MNVKYENIPGCIKYLSILDRENSPIIMINFSDQSLEIDYQMMVFSSLDLIEYKEIQKKNKNQVEDYLGLLLPFYEYEFDVGSYGYLSKNGYKLIIMKKLEPFIQETASNIKLKEIFSDIQNRLNRLLLNPFYDKSSFSNEKNKEKENFKNDLCEIIKIKQIY